MQPTNAAKIGDLQHVECNYVDEEEDVENAETRSAPGDLQKPSSSREYHFPFFGIFFPLIFCRKLLSLITIFFAFIMGCYHYYYYYY